MLELRSFLIGLGIGIVLALIIALYPGNAQNGRFVVDARVPDMLLDSQTGDTYLLTSKGWSLKVTLLKPE